MKHDPSQQFLYPGAKRDIFPRSSVSTKLPTYQAPTGAPMDEEEAEAYRELIADIVSIAWKKLQRPISLDEIYDGAYTYKDGIVQEQIKGVAERVRSRIKNELWPFAQYVRSKRTVDRRVNEAASDDFCPDNISYLALVAPGIYQPNPKRMVQKT